MQLPVFKFSCVTNKIGNTLNAAKRYNYIVVSAFVLKARKMAKAFI